MAFNRNRGLEVNQGRTEVNTGATQPIAVGHDMDEWYMPVWAGVDPATGKPLWEGAEFSRFARGERKCESNHSANRQPDHLLYTAGRNRPESESNPKPLMRLV
jgi:hypothetical protein